MHVLQYAPGQKATIYFETLDVNGARADAPTAPIITRIIFPDLSLAADFPQSMVKLDVGLYYFQMTLPFTAAGVGSYLADILYQDPTTLNNKNAAIQIIVTAPFGNYTAMAG